ncbi:hypothetical protein BDV23DRAFT_138919 [Aspergillus alliaceus]|uniref:Uncharacterized protein n=1 Tax=Petromyces alliaceus TaxID=209559 RepID=A0A5N7BYC3_PETAA|nr:hypothetical protein BDV23DRAFT_138919 [Aspergillus alliaceus]
MARCSVHIISSPSLPPPALLFFRCELPGWWGCLDPLGEEGMSVVAYRLNRSGYMVDPDVRDGISLCSSFLASGRYALFCP